MKRTFAFAMLLVLLLTGSAFASDSGDFKKIKIFDDIIVFTDVDDMLPQGVVREEAIRLFGKYMGDMVLNDNAYVDNYPAEGYTIENVGYIMIKVMSIRTKGGVNAYHVDFEFGVPPRQVYWDTAVMGVAPTTFDFKKELFEDLDEVMQKFATAFNEKRSQ